MKEKGSRYIYHYTSMEALNSILLSTHELWFSDASGMNDKNELTEFLGKLERATKRVDNPEYNEKQKAFFEKVYSAKDDSYPFIMCFSTNRDDAAQWERYADNAKGVCIRFNQPLLEMLLRKTSLPVFFQEVFYVHDIREHAHYKNVVDLLEKGCCEGFDEDGLIGNIIATAPNFKHISFSSESEIRAIILFAPQGKDVHFEMRNGLVKKIVKVDLLELCKQQSVDFQDLFDEIIIGPRSEQNIQILKEYLTTNNLDKVAAKVKLSECPLR